MKESIASAWRICCSYRRAGFVAWSHAALRLVLVPVGALREVLSEASGEVLSIGAGTGIVECFLADRLPELSFTCSDYQAKRIDIARRAVQLSRVRFMVADATVITHNSIYSAALAVDVLHHIARENQATAVEGLVGAVQPDGLIIIKDIALTPPWKHTWNRIHDRLVSGDDPACREPEEVAAMLEEAGCLVEQCCRLHPYSPYPHYLVVARKCSNELRHGAVLN